MNKIQAKNWLTIKKVKNNTCENEHFCILQTHTEVEGDL